MQRPIQPRGYLDPFLEAQIERSRQLIADFGACSSLAARLHLTPNVGEPTPCQMSKADQYRKQAEEMRRLAASMPSPLLKAEYLKLAESWDELARNADPAADKPKLGRW